MKQPALPIVYVDMDDVLCDYLNAHAAAMQWTGLAYQWTGLAYPQSVPGFYRNLQPLPGAIEGYHALEERYDVRVLTRPSYRNLHCYTEKAEWVLHHLGETAQEKMILAPDKSRLIGDYLIDDSLHFGQAEFGGELLHFGTPACPDWAAVVARLLPEKC